MPAYTGQDLGVHGHDGASTSSFNGSYRTQLMNHVSYIQRNFGDSVESPFPTQLFSRTDMPDDALYFVTKLWRDVVAMRQELRSAHAAPRRAAEGGGADEFLYLTPYTGANGDVQFYDRLKGRVVVSLRRQPNGLYSYYGPASYLTRIGGRGEMSQIIKMLEDGDLFHDHPVRKVLQ